MESRQHRLRRGEVWVVAVRLECIWLQPRRRLVVVERKP
jgi:hypothetical protein